MNTTFRGAAADALSERWWVSVVRGIAAIAFGILAIVTPSLGLLALVIVWGVYAIVDGISNMMLAAWSGSAGGRWGWFAFQGLIGVAAGAFTFAYPGITAMVLVTVIALWAVLTGVIEIAAAIELRHVKGDWALALGGVLSIALGVLLMANPGKGALALAWLIGAYAIAFGVSLIGLGSALRRVRRAVKEAFPAAPAPTPA